MLRMIGMLFLIDSGCTYLMSPFKHLFSNYVEVSGKHVCLADDKKCNVAGVGDVILKFETDFNITLKHVKHVPDLTYNLMSYSALEDEVLEGR